MNILIINQPLKNRGDEAAHRGLLHFLMSKYPNIKINILFSRNYDKSDVEEFRVKDSNVNYIVVSYFKIVAYIIHRINKVLLFLGLPLQCSPLYFAVRKYYSEADIIICAPGGICLGGFMCWNHMFMLYVAKIEQKKIIYFARSIGPFRNSSLIWKVFYKRSKVILDYCHAISLRDIKSQHIADSINVKYVQTIDSAFLNNDIIDIPFEIKEQLNMDNYIVLVPNSLVWHYNFKLFTFENILSFFVDLLNSIMVKFPGVQVVMLPQTMGDYSDWKHKEGKEFFDLIKLLSSKPDNVYVLDDKYGSNIQQAIIKNSKFLIGCRYHSIVFAINQSIPFISLTYEHKMSGLLESLGLLEYEISVNQLLNGDISVGIAKILQMLDNIQLDDKVAMRAKNIATSAANKLFDNL